MPDPDHKSVPGMQVTTSIESTAAGAQPQSAVAGAAKSPAAPRLKTLLEFVAWIVLEHCHAPQNQKELSQQLPSGGGERPPHPAVPSGLKAQQLHLVLSHTMECQLYTSVV